MSDLIERLRDKWTRADSIRLHAGEMTAQEMRTAQAVAKAIIGEVDAALTSTSPAYYLNPLDGTTCTAADKASGSPVFARHTEALWTGPQGGAEPVVWPMCPYCNGKGRVIDYVGPRMAPEISTCEHCNGEGFDPDASPPSPTIEVLREALEKADALIQFWRDYRELPSDQFAEKYQMDSATSSLRMTELAHQYAEALAALKSLEPK